MIDHPSTILATIHALLLCAVGKKNLNFALLYATEGHVNMQLGPLLDYDGSVNSRVTKSIGHDEGMAAGAILSTIVIVHRFPSDILVPIGHA